MTINCEKYIRKLFSVPQNSAIIFEELNITKNNDPSGIECHIKIQKGKKYSTFIIKKPLEAITYEDVDLLYQSFINYAVGNRPFKKTLLKFFGWWIIFGGTLTAFSVCPICGQLGCPIGIGTTGLLAGFLALVKQYSNDFFYLLKNLFAKKNSY